METLHRRGYRFTAAVEGAASVAPARREPGPEPQTTTAPGGTAKLRLVVLPFTNLNDDRAQDYFSDGLTEEMITQIGRLCPTHRGLSGRT